LGTVCVFIDGGYFEQVMKSRFASPKIDFNKLSQEIAKTIAPETIILRTYFYDALPFKSSEPTEEERILYDNKQRFLYTINQLPRYQVRYGRCVQRGVRSDGRPRYTQKQVDVLLSVDLARLSAKGKINYAAIVGGDTDFVPAIEIAKEEGVIIYLFHEEGFRRNELWSIADERIVISKQLIDKTIIK
jgi:uncharacterized LabA/DUF88 family protein